MEIEKAFTGELTQKETNYVPLSAVQGKACASCRWFMAYGDCYIVEDDPEPILATGYCARHEATPEPEPVADVAEVIAEALGEVLEEQAETIATSIYASPMWDGKGLDKPGVVERLLKAIKNIRKSKPQDDAFSVFKGADGNWHWHAIFTNNFEDLEQEILTEKAHDNYIARLDMGLVPMPVLQRWHTPGTEHGKARILWRDGHFVHAAGDFDETPNGEKALAYYRKNTGKSKMSHGFTVPEWAFDGKHYDDYNAFEITTLPPNAAANPYTSFEEIKEMAMTDEKRRDLEAMFGKERVAEIEAKDSERGKALEDLKIQYKDFANIEAKKPEAVKPETEKALTAVYGELVGNISEVVEIVGLQAKAIAAKDTQIAALKAEKDTQVSQLQKSIDELRTIVNAPPKRASQDDSTINTDTTLKDKLPSADPLQEFFGVPFKPVGSN